MRTLRLVPYYGSLMLLAYMPFHVFLSQWLSTFTGGLGGWKVAKDVVAMFLVIVSIGLVIWTKTYRRTPYLIFVALAFVYLVLHIVIYLVNRNTTLEIAALATVYNNRLLWFLIIGFSAGLLTPQYLSTRKMIKLVLIISTIVVGLGLLQYVLPKDLMTHFGYSLERGVKPAFFIDDKPDLPRIMSSLRDPNSLGAFLILPLSLLWTYLLDKKHSAKRLLLWGLCGLHGLALFLTFSRGAWLGAGISLSLVTLVMHARQLKAWLKRFWPALLVAGTILFIGIYSLRGQYVVQNVIFHSDETTVSKRDSNEYHLFFAQQGLKGLLKRPLGHGPGTAGIVSIQNEGKGLLTENYFIQIGYEAGIFAVLTLAVVLYMVYKRVAERVRDHLAIGLFAAFWGLLILSLVAHLWTNEAIAAYWWLLAGVLIARGSPQKSSKTAVIL